MHVTVAICTWNRAALLDRTLAEFARLRVPADVTWELLVVDNNCTDDTAAVVAAHTTRLPVRRLVEPCQGLGYARNRAVAAAAGELLLWTDDDVLVDPTWLEAHVAAARAFPAASFFGGTIDPWFETEPPAWVRRHLDRLQGVYALRRRGPAVEPLDPAEAPEAIYGANMAFRTAVLKQHPFDGRLGHRGTELGGYEETELFTRLVGLGHGGLWVGPARVRHFIATERLSPRYVRKHHYYRGRTAIRRTGPPGGKTFLGAPRWMVRRRWLATLQAGLLAPTRGTAWFRALYTAAFDQGCIDECRARSRAADPAAGPVRAGGSPLDPRPTSPELPR